MDALLRVEDVEASYGKAPVLFGVTVEVHPGEVVALIGANGAGKSSVLKVVAGLLPPSRGRILFQGEPIHRVPPHQIVARGLTLVPQYRRIFATLTVEENLELGGYTQRRDRRRFRETREEVYALFPVLAGKRRLLGGLLSGGEQQLLAIARGMMARPHLMMLDEPSMGLSPRLTLEVFRDIRRVAATGRTILVVEQNAYAALAIARRAYVLENGRVALSGEASELVHDDYIRKTYLAA